MNKKRYVIRIAALIMLCAFALTGLCACSEDEIGGFTVNEKIVCEVDGEPITYDDYKYFFYTNLISMQQVEPSTDFSTGEGYKRIIKLTESSLARRQVILDLCDEYGLEISDTDMEAVNNFVQNEINNRGGEAAYREYLLENRLTGNIFREQTMLTFCYDLYLREHLKLGVNKGIDMTPEAIIADVTGGNFYRYTQILLRLDVGELSVPLQEKANEAYYKLISGVGFSEVASEYSEWSKDHDAGVYSAIGEKEAILEDNVLALEVGEFSEVIQSSEGFHIFKRLPIDAEYVEENYEIFEEQYFNRCYLEFIEKEASKLKIEYAKYFDSIDYAMLTRKEEID